MARDNEELSAGSAMSIGGSSGIPLSTRRATRRLDRLPLADQVYEALRDAVIEGTYPEGTQLVQDALAEQLGVSRTPVRDALIRLAHDGLITAAGVRGYMVTEPPAGAMADICDVRALLEPYAARSALDHMSEARLQHLESINRAIEPDGDERSTREYLDLNRRFHLGLVEGCTNELALQMLRDVWESPRRRRIWAREQETLDIAEMLRQHEGIVAAARARDPDKLSRLLIEHICSASPHR